MILTPFAMDPVQIAHHYTIDHQAVAQHHLQTMTPEELNNDWRLGEFFGTIFVINLPQDTVRLQQVKKALKEVGVDRYEVFEAIDGRKAVDERLWKKMDRNWAKIDISTAEGQAAFDKQRQAETGCYLSHLGIIKLVQKRFTKAMQELAEAYVRKDAFEAQRALKRLKESSSVLILEDDNGFGIVRSNGRSAYLGNGGTLLRRAMKALPNEWQMLYLMAWSKEPATKVSPHLVQLSRGICLNAYAVNATFYETAIRQLEKIYDPAIFHVDPVDNELAKLHKQVACYAVNPSIAYQRMGLSSITSKASAKLRQKQPKYDNL